MTPRYRPRTTIAVALCAALLSLPLATSATARPATDATAAPDIPVREVRHHLGELERITAEHGGNRAHGTPGYTAALRYVAAELTEAGYRTRIQSFTHEGATGYNLLAEWPPGGDGGDSGGSGDGKGSGGNRDSRGGGGNRDSEGSGGGGSDVLMVGAHLDSRTGTPGMNDNASGAAALLVTALTVARTGYEPGKRLRFAWWGAEEEAAIGSYHYVGQLSEGEIGRLSAYLNYDMIASPNAGYFVYDDDPAIERVYQDWFHRRGIETEPATELTGRSDHVAFLAVNVPVGGTFTGADYVKSVPQARKWGGSAGEPYDACYHATCDTTSNINLRALDLHADVMAHTAWKLSSKP